MKKAIIGVLALVVVAAGAYFGLTSYGDSKAKERADALITKLTSKNKDIKISYGSVKTEAYKQGVVMTNVVIDRGPKGKATIDRIEVRDFDWTNEQPRYMTVRVVGFRSPTAAVGKEAKSLKEMGYEEVVLNATLSYRYNPDNKTLVLSQLLLEGQDMAIIEIKMSYGNVTMPPSNAPPEAALGMVGKITLVSASVTLKDRSLISRAIKAQAAKSNISEAEAKAKVLGQIDKEIQTATDPFKREVLEAVRKFVANPGTLSVTVRPPKPMPVMMLWAVLSKNPGQAKSMLGLTIAAN